MEKSIPKPILMELMPEELKEVSDTDLDIIIQHANTLSNSGLDNQKESPSPPRSTSPLTSHVSGEESLGKPKDLKLWTRERILRMNPMIDLHPKTRKGVRFQEVAGGRTS